MTFASAEPKSGEPRSVRRCLACKNDQGHPFNISAGRRLLTVHVRCLECGRQWDITLPDPGLAAILND